MPKKSPTARGGAQRNKPKVQKSFELVRPGSANEQAFEVVEADELTDTDADTTDAPSAAALETPVEEPPTQTQTQAPKPFAVKSRAPATSVATRVEEPVVPVISTPTAPKGSAAAKMAARRQSNLKAQQRASASLITAEHFTYVRKDLRFIAILAAIMFAVIIILHFVPGIGS